MMRIGRGERAATRPTADQRAQLFANVEREIPVEIWRDGGIEHRECVEELAQQRRYWPKQASIDRSQGVSTHNKARSMLTGL